MSRQPLQVADIVRGYEIEKGKYVVFDVHLSDMLTGNEVSRQLPGRLPPRVVAGYRR